jgi:hypothetical protein
MAPMKIVALLLLALCPPAFAADDAEANRAAFAALYARMNTAMSEKNLADLGALLAPGFQGEDVAGKTRTAKQLLQEVAALKDDPNRRLETTFSGVAVEGGIARMVRRLRITTTKSVGDKTPAMEYVALSDDTWTRTEQSWKLTTSTVRQADFSMQGKLLMHKTHEPR